MIFSREEKNWLIVESSRVGLFFLIILFSLSSYLFQKQFIDWKYLVYFYGALMVVMSFHLVLLIKLEWFYKKPNLLMLTFIVDLLAVSSLVFKSDLNQTFFLFSFLVLIAFGGLVFRGPGALQLALYSSLFFNFFSLWSLETRPFQHILLLAVNNLAFFVVAALSGYLSEQFFKTSEELTKTGLNLKSLERLNELIFENIPSGLFTFNREGVIVQANHQAEQIFESQNLLGLKVNHFLPLQFSEKDQSRDFVFETPAKTKKNLLSRTQTFHHGPSQQDLKMAVVDDLTPLRELEARAKQSEKLAAIGALAAGIAHEIRNPLAGISGSVEMLSQNTSNDDDKKLMKIILKEIDRLNNLITEFLDYSRPDQPPTDRIQLQQALNEVLDSLALNKNLRQDVVVERKISATPAILGRPDKLKQAFLNICINAYQAMQKTENAVLKVSVDLENNSVVVRIKDSGEGMSEATQKKLFEPFHTTKPKGTGLGLAVTYKIMESHRGQIKVLSTPGQGTEFVLVFPCAEQ